jgi:drug/metabolite transporter (DMT)-like permease
MGHQQQQDTDHAALPVSAAPTQPAAPGGRLLTAGLVAAWYASNIGVLLLNKYLLSVYGFRFPVLLTACHMSACALLSCLAHLASASPGQSAARSGAQLARVALLGAVFCASVVAGNVSLRYLPVSFNQAVGATTPFFTAFLAYAVAARTEALATYAALVPVVAGVVLATGVGQPPAHSAKSHLHFFSNPPIISFRFASFGCPRGFDARS